MSVTHTPKVNSRVSSNKDCRALGSPDWKKISGDDQSTNYPKADCPTKKSETLNMRLTERQARANIL